MQKQKIWQVDFLDENLLTDKPVRNVSDPDVYTSDSDALLVFRPVNIEKDFNTAKVAMVNKINGTIVHKDMEIRSPEEGMKEAYFNLSTDDIIKHWGVWDVQVIIFDTNNKGTTGPIVNFEIKKYLMDERVPRMEAVGNWEDLEAQAQLVMESWIDTIADIESAEATRQQAELDRQAQEEAREETHEKVKDLPEAFQSVIDETTGKDVISAPEIIAARRGKASLGEKIDELDFQLNRVPEYVASRGQNLVTNGTGLLKDNTNFSGAIFDGSDNYGSNGSFTYSADNGNLLQDELIPIDPSETYRFTYYIKANPYVGAHAYGVIVSFDSDGQMIDPRHTMYVKDTLTELVQDLKPGDTKVYLKDVSNWRNDGTAGVNTHLNTIILWNYVNRTGYQYPPLTYSRNVWFDMWDPGAIDFTENSITLKNPWDKDFVVAGTKLSNGSSGGAFKYIAGSHFVIPENWTRYSGTIGGIDTTGKNNANSFHPGTARIKIGWRLNRDVTGSKSWLTNISFGLDTAVSNIQAPDLSDYVLSNRVLTDVPANAKFTDTTYTAGTGINITGDVISATGGDSSVEVEEARVDASGHTNATLKERLDKEHAEVTAQLAHTAYVAIKPNGVDDTDAIQDKVDELDSRGGGTLIIPRGVYWINANKYGTGMNKKYGVKLPSNIRIEMKNAVLKVIPNNDENYSVFFLDNVENTQIVGGVIEGDKFDHLGTTGEWGHGLNIQGVDTKNILVEKLQVKNCWGDGIYVEDVFGGNIVFDNITIEDCRRHEMAIVGGRDIKIINSTLTKTSGVLDGIINASYGGMNIDIESHNGERSWSKDISITGCTFINTVNACVRFDDNYKNDNARVSECSFYGEGLEVGNGEYCIINNNRLMPYEDHNGQYGIRITYIDSAEITGNIVNGKTYGISSWYEMKNVNISSNNIRDCERGGIALLGADVPGKGLSKDISITNNTVDNCGYLSPWDLHGSAVIITGYGDNFMRNVSFVGNKIINSAYHGIFVDFVDNLQINNNNFVDFQLEDASISNLVRVRGSETVAFSLNTVLIMRQPTLTRCPVQFERCDSVIINGNMFRKAEGVANSYFVEFVNAKNVFSTSNDFYNSCDVAEYINPPTISSNNRLRDGTLEVVL